MAGGDLDRAQSMAWRLLGAGVTELAVLENGAELLFGSGRIAQGIRFARIAAVIAPHRPRSYAGLVRFGAETNVSGHAFRPGTWALACDPGNVVAARRAGALARDAGHGEVALIYLARSLELSPISALTWTSVGVLRSRLGDLVAARQALVRAVCLAPGIVDSWFALGNAMTKLRDGRLATRCFRRAVTGDPGHAAAHSNLGHALRRGRHARASISAFQRALVLDPGQVSVLISLGQLALSENSIAVVKTVFARARLVDPENPEARFFEGLADLRTGDFAAGWPAYFWHVKLDFPKIEPCQSLPRWPEQEASPTGLLVWNDQVGIGEEVMYLGALGQLAEQVPLRAVQCSPKLAPLVRRSFPHLAVSTAAGAVPPGQDMGSRPAAVPLVAAVAALRRRFEDFPAHPGYLVADPDRVAELRRRYAGTRGRPLIGISWSNPRGFQGPDKSVPLAEWGPVFAALDARFISLQYTVDGAEIADEIAEARRRHGVEILVDPDLDSFADLDGHAAQIAAMDRVLSISNIAAHLAGALGRPVEMIYPNEIALLWYWFHDRAVSPWYPSMTIHRPPPGGDRAGLMQALAHHLSGET